MKGCLSFPFRFLSTSFIINREEMERRLQERIEERARQDQAVFAEMEKHARCVLLPSPEEFNTSVNAGGSDATGTLNDFDSFLKWADKMGLYNTGHLIRQPGKGMEEGRYRGMISFAFNLGYAALQNTKSPMLNELMFCYYAGHGLDKKKCSKMAFFCRSCTRFSQKFF